MTSASSSKTVYRSRSGKENRPVLKAQDVMTRDLVTVHPQDTIVEALQLLEENRVSALPVVDSRGHCVGILSTTDVLAIALNVEEELDRIDEVDDSTRRWLIEKLRESSHERVQDVMTERVDAVAPTTSLAVVAREMLRHRVHRMPVIDKQQRIVGIVSTMDLLEAFATQLES